MITAAQHDAYARAGRSTVLRVDPAPDGRYHALLDDSVLYAEGGGQPFDLGTVGGVEVVAVRPAEGGVLHELVAPVPLGEAEVVVDWARRFDHMQQHTGQHLLSALAQDRFGWATTSFHLQVGLDAICDVELDAPEIGAAALAALQDAVNEVIREARPVRPRLVDALPAGVRSRGLPEGHQGPIRLVEIEGVDLNTCGGTHLRSTAELQGIALLGAERIRGGTRVYFVVGQRVLRRLGVAEQRLGELGAKLSCGPQELLPNVDRLLDEAKAASRARQALADELADALGGALATEDRPVRALHREDGDTAFLNRVASAVLRQAPDAVVWLTAGPREGQFLLAAPPDRIAAVKEQVLEILGAKGGGPPGRLQGRATRLDRRDEVAALLGP